MFILLCLYQTIYKFFTFNFHKNVENATLHIRLVAVTVTINLSFSGLPCRFSPFRFWPTSKPRHWIISLYLSQRKKKNEMGNCFIEK